MKKLLMMIGAAAVAVGANAATTIIYGPDAYGLIWTNEVVSGTNVKLTGSSGNNTAVFDAADIPWTFTVDGVEYTVTQMGSVFKNWKNLTGDMSIPDVVTTLGSIENIGITSLSIGSGASSIPSYWAKNTESLECLVVPSTVTSIGSQLVYSCDKIKALWIKGPATVASGTQTYTSFNGDGAIARCSILETVLFGPNTKWTAASGKFIDDTNSLSKNMTTKLFVPENGYWGGAR